MLLQATVGAVPMVLVVVVTAALLAGWVALGYWVYRDARAREVDRSRQWALASLVCWPVVLAYLWQRRQSGADPEYAPAESGTTSAGPGANPSGQGANPSGPGANPSGSGATQVETRRERLAKAVLAAVLTAFLAGVVIAPPDPITQIYFLGGALVVSTPLAYLLVYRDVLGRRETPT